ncbi:hypothetical protein [Nocardia tengchongensis]|uniref:hypothetical protein n=1 Tax=Nocardia tengchongensis TaxID=2055889 RepID=UPI00365391BC
MSDLRKINRADAIEVLWPIRGPYTADSFVTASIAIEHLWRYLTHLTLRSESRQMDSPADVCIAIGNLANSSSSASQVFSQFNQWADRIKDQSELAHDEDLPRHLISGVVAVGESALRSAASQYEVAAQQLYKAAAVLGHLYLDHDERGRPS